MMILPVGGGTHGRSNIPPGHGIPPCNVGEVLVAQGVPGECNVPDVRYPESHKVVANDLDFGRR